MFDGLTWIIAGAAFGSFLLGWQSRVWTWRTDRARKLPSLGSSRPRDQSFDAADQLRTVMGATYNPRSILSRGERRVFDAAEISLRSIRPNWRVMAQVSLGEVLRASDPSAHAVVNSKRVDMLIVDEEGLPRAAIEYQGAGHYQGTAAARDAVKKEALRRAGVAYLEVRPGERHSDLHASIARAVEAQSVLSGLEARRA